MKKFLYLILSLILGLSLSTPTVKAKSTDRDEDRIAIEKALTWELYAGPLVYVYWARFEECKLVYEQTNNYKQRVYHIPMGNIRSEHLKVKEYAKDRGGIYLQFEKPLVIQYNNSLETSTSSVFFLIKDKADWEDIKESMLKVAQNCL